MKGETSFDSRTAMLTCHLSPPQPAPATLQAPSSQVVALSAALPAGSAPVSPVSGARAATAA